MSRSNGTLHDVVPWRTFVLPRGDTVGGVRVHTVTNSSRVGCASGKAGKLHGEININLDRRQSSFRGTCRYEGSFASISYNSKWAVPFEKVPTALG